MEKKYCIHCKTLYNEVRICSTCGNNEFQVIIIDVQHQQSSSHPE